MGLTGDLERVQCLDSTQLLDVCTSVWNDMLSLIVEPAPPSFGPARNGSLIGCVQILGGWEGVLTLQTSPRFARLAAAVMFDIEPAAVAPDEIMDTLGELTNMLGGTAKALLPGPSMLSLPTVAEGDSYSMTFPGAEIVARVDASCAGEPLVVALLTRRS